MLIIAGLLVILALVLVMPFINHKVEANLEIFLFGMGLAAALTSGLISQELILKALEEPLMISAAVLIAGLLFQYFNTPIKKGIDAILQAVPLKVFVLLIVIVLGLISSVITAIIASLVLVEIINTINIDRRSKINLNIVACFSIGLGAALTPIGEPLSTIVVSKMNADFWYLFRLLGIYVIPGIFGFGVISTFFVGSRNLKLQPATPENAPVNEREMITDWDAPADEQEPGSDPKETYSGVAIRAGKVYLFVIALVLLGEGFKPLIDTYVLGLSSKLLYWINMVSAVLDNATLAAAEVSPLMNQAQVQSVLMGLLISGGMLIPGNIPNIISASKLKITSRQWARLGVPLGLVTMITYFIILEL